MGSRSGPTVADTEALLARYRAGDAEAFALLYERHAPAVRRSVAARMSRRLRELSEMDDVLQGAFVRVWKYLGRGGQATRTLGSFLRLVVAMSMREIQDLARSSRRGRRSVDRTLPLVDLQQEPPSAGPRPSQEARARELAELSERAFVGLAERDRLVIDCRDNLEMTYGEIGAELGCQPANAKLRYFRAKERWRTALQALTDRGARQ